MAVRTAFISSHAELGGAELNLEALLTTLGSDWVTRVVLLADGPFVERAARLGQPLALVPTGRRLGVLSGAWRLRRLLRRDAPEVVFANGVKAALVSVIATAGLRVPVVWRKVDYSFDGRLARLIAARTALVIGVSAGVLETLDGSSRSVVIYNGVPEATGDRDSARALLEEVAGFGGGPIVLLPGRLHPEKGQLDLIEAAPAIREAHPDARFAIAGAPDPSAAGYPAELESRTRSLGLEPVVSFLGYRTDLRSLIGGADVVVIPSRTEPSSGWREGFGLVAAEAMVAGTPVVAYSSGSLPEVVGDAGLLVPEGDTRALGEAVSRLLRDRRLAETVAGRGRRRAREKFGLERAIERYEAALLDVASRLRAQQPRGGDRARA